MSEHNGIADRGVSVDFAALAMESAQNLTPYQPGKPVSELQRELGLSDIVKLASNENPLGISSYARQAVDDQLSELARYPDGNGFALKKALGGFHDLSTRRITLGNGSNDVLDLIARAYLGPGREAVFSQYAFAVYPISTIAAGGTCRVAAARDYGHDLQAMRALVNEHTRVVFIANPNNPTGTWLKSAELESFIADMPRDVLVVVDEAYVEYVAEESYPDASRWLDEFDNLIVTRTFSKAHGLAGLRIGYALSNPQVADMLNRVRQPFNANSLALAAAEASLADDRHIEASVKLNHEQMAVMESGLGALGLKYIPSVGNFLCVEVGDKADEVNTALLNKGVIVRPVANYGLDQHLRVSIGLAEENHRFLDAMWAVLGKPGKWR